jgi:uncharacterized protein (TIGR00251 family)
LESVVARIEVRVTPRAARTSIAGFDAEGRLLVRLSAPPINGKANRALIDLLARTLGISKRRVSMDRGERGRTKLIEVEGMSDVELRTVLENMTS